MGVTDDISVNRTDGGALVFDPSAKAGLLFYLGGKVEYTAYSPLMRACAEQGILCVLVKMPCNLAILDMNAADGIAVQYPEIEDWYIGGHSLGGAMADAMQDLGIMDHKKAMAYQQSLTRNRLPGQQRKLQKFFQ